MIHKKKVPLIVMLCQFEEDSRKKCDRYFPKLGEALNLDDIIVNLSTEEEVLPEAIIMRELLVHHEEQTQSVIQLQIICWPDHDQPDKVRGYDTMDIVISYIAEYRSRNAESPVLIHCSAGLGRTGCLIGIYNIVKSLHMMKVYNKNCKEEEKKVEPFFSVFNIVRKLREQRNGMVTSSTQYKYMYEFCAEWIKKNFDN